MTTTLLSEVVEQWNVLAERETKPAYRITKPVTSLDTRDTITKWLYRTIDYYSIDRSVVSCALVFFEQYTSRQSSVDFEQCQLIAMASLYLASKMSSNDNPLTISRLVALSNDYFTAVQVYRMESRIINTLDWYLNPPIPALFVDSVLPFINDLMEEHPEVMHEEVRDVTWYLVELSACDHIFVAMKPSSIAYAATLLAFDIASVPSHTKDRFEALHLQNTPHMTEICIQRLRKVYDIAISNAEDEVSRLSESSPTVVSQDDML